jgi:tRNA(Ile)-lysidine synthetase-like protein
MHRAGPSADGELRGLRRDPAVRALALEWRRLTGGRRRGLDTCRRTVLAVSGGGDSCGLAIALCAAVSEPRGLFVLAHVVHDLRPESLALADRDAARELAGRLGVPFAEERIGVRAAGGNLEGSARRLRYEALVRVADRDGCGFVATAHHGGDQLETLLMGLLRGAGPDGLGGVRDSRRLSRDVTLIRPALTLARSELQRVCREFGWEWREDATNQDLARTRAALRHRVVPVLEELRPGAETRAARSARLLAGAACVINSGADALLDAAGHADQELQLERQKLRGQPAVMIGAVLRRAAVRLRGLPGRDRFGAAVLDPMIEAIQSDRTEPRTFVNGRLEVTITARSVVMRRCA